jgi:hypothetical protein
MHQLKTVRGFLRAPVMAGLLVLLQTQVAGATDVYWSGFGFDGEFAAAEGRYPNSFALSQQMQDDRPILDMYLGEKAQAVDNKSFEIVFDKGSIGPNAPFSIALGFVLDRETVSVEPIGGRYKVLVTLSAQAMFFDFKEMAIVSTYPFSMNYIHAQSKRPTQQDIREIVENMYIGAGKENLFDHFVTVLSQARLNTRVSKRIQVTSVTVDPSVKDKLPAVWRNDMDDFSVFLSQQFGRSLSEQQNVPVLPTVKGHAIGNRMSASFSDGRVFDLEIPEADYSIALSLKKLVKIEYAKVAAGTSFIYGSYLGVKAEEPFSGRPYVDTTIKNGEVKKVPADQAYVDDWPAYQDSILMLFSKFASEIDSPSKDWVEKHIGDISVRKQLSEFGKVVQSCR